ncbi:hypothetical protein LSCM1_00652 [Leishmania martiniquensis]|uniref:Uncharacterized protein n=1 Tax=Leishmania martiniquensis TaxID=1580590 RepID=A0A836GIH0_9TRYP|nr:hypothetical protein LSCM1_00652 [Leishmania martiniquensis]
MLLFSMPRRRLAGVNFLFNSGSLVRRGVVATSHFAVRIGASRVETTAPPPFCAALVACLRHRSTVAQSSWWRLSKSARSWRQKRTASSSRPPQRRTAATRQSTPTSTRQQRVTGAKTRKGARGRQPQKRLSAHQRQAKKYNKRVEAIARLWKAQQQQQHMQLQGASTSSQKSLAPRST